MALGLIHICIYRIIGCIRVSIYLLKIPLRCDNNLSYFVGKNLEHFALTTIVSIINIYTHDNSNYLLKSTPNLNHKEKLRLIYSKLGNTLEEVRKYKECMSSMYREAKCRYIYRV
jgi:hypothetical protein